MKRQRMRTANKWKSYPVESDLQTLGILELSDTEPKSSVLISLKK